MTLDLAAERCAVCGAPLSDHRRADNRSIACRGSLADEALTLAELGALLKLAPRTIYAHRKRHDHPAILELPKLGPGHPRFSKRAVEAWLANQPAADVSRRRAHLRLARAR